MSLPALLLFIYIEDFPALLSLIANKLKPNGTLVFSQEHPITTCHKEGERWEKNEKKQQVAYRLNHYRDEGLRERNWFQQPFKTYHRTMATIINDLIAVGFQIEQMAEPMLAEQPQWHDEFKDLRHRPPLLFIKARKVDEFKQNKLVFDRTLWYKSHRCFWVSKAAFLIINNTHISLRLNRGAKRSIS